MFQDIDISLIQLHNFSLILELNVIYYPFREVKILLLQLCNLTKLAKYKKNFLGLFRGLEIENLQKD